jgi:ABC-type transporter MlaC component
VSGIVRTALAPVARDRASAIGPQIASLPANPGASAGPTAPGGAPASLFVTAFLDDAFRIARATSAAPARRRTELADLLTTRMDIGRILQYATHSEFQTASPAVQQQFRTSFAAFLAEAYTPRIEMAAGFSFAAAPPKPAGSGMLVVSTTFSKPGYPEQQIEWKLAPSGNGFRIVDVSSGGVSLLDIQRWSFESVMRNGGLPGLLARLDVRTRELASSE